MKVLSEKKSLRNYLDIVVIYDKKIKINLLVNESPFGKEKRWVGNCVGCNNIEATAIFNLMLKS